MCNSQTVRKRIATLLVDKPFNQKQMLKDCGASENLLNQMSDNKGIGCFVLARIADYLECSVDYILGRSDNPNMTNSINNSNTTVNGTQANIINNPEPLDEMTQELLRIFKDLSFTEKMEIMNTVMNKATQNNG